MQELRSANNGEENEVKRGQAEANKTELQEKLELLKKLDDEILELIYEKEENDVIDKEMQEAADYKQRILCTFFFGGIFERIIIECAR